MLFTFNPITVVGCAAFRDIRALSVDMPTLKLSLVGIPTFCFSFTVSKSVYAAANILIANVWIINFTIRRKCSYREKTNQSPQYQPIADSR